MDAMYSMMCRIHSDGLLLIFADQGIKWDLFMWITRLVPDTFLDNDRYLATLADYLP